MKRAWPRWLGWARNPEHERRLTLLAGAPLFAGLPRRLLGRLCVLCFEKAYAVGDVVFFEGEPGRALFIVLDGTVAISQGSAGGEQVLRTLGTGAAFGELALIDDFPRSATVRVIAPSRLLILYRSDFNALVEGNRGIALVVLRNLLKALAVYVRRTTAPISDRGTALAEAPTPGGSGRSAGPL